MSLVARVDLRAARAQDDMFNSHSNSPFLFPLKKLPPSAPCVYEQQCIFKSLDILFLKQSSRAGEMAQRLGALTAVTGDLFVVPRGS